MVNDKEALRGVDIDIIDCHVAALLAMTFFVVFFVTAGGGEFKNIAAELR